VPGHSKLCINHEVDSSAFPEESDSIERSLIYLKGLKTLNKSNLTEWHSSQIDNRAGF
jgi:hypothetical protein